jgi:hypothetical protein
MIMTGGARRPRGPDSSTDPARQLAADTVFVFRRVPMAAAAAEAAEKVIGRV